MGRISVKTVAVIFMVIFGGLGVSGIVAGFWAIKEAWKEDWYIVFFGIAAILLGIFLCFIVYNILGLLTG